MSRIETIKLAIMADPQNKAYTDRGIEPLFAAPKNCSYQYYWTGSRNEDGGSWDLLEG